MYVIMSLVPEFSDFPECPVRRACLAGNLVAGGRATDGMANPIQSNLGQTRGESKLEISCSHRRGAGGDRHLR